MTPHEQLTLIIRQILDRKVGQIFDINLHCEVGRQEIADIIALQLCDEPSMLVIDVMNAGKVERQAIDAAFTEVHGVQMSLI